MQLVQLVAVTFFFFAGFVAAIPGPVEMRSPENDISELLESRGTIHCANVAKIKRPTRYEKEGCIPERSRGFGPAHNCFNKGGRAYLCVQGGQSFCIHGSSVKKNNYENGECFM
ncbi:hypothetical protein D9613_009809 [Agrocybe pediades]|uniref:Uncharacterized protein n=1 Tax=Agrocybe pediades TaxID=84607 RepID=A0A8H4QWT7_9AGAR|nr:hypothetical protein D9613_009809 [Agrocybe pediades]